MKTLLSIVIALAVSVASLRAAGPYHAETLEGLAGSLVTADGEPGTVDRLSEKKYLFIYFSAHWCPPCRTFTPRLVEFYNTHFKNGDFDLLFVSSDKNQNAMNEYMKGASMPWLGLKPGSAKVKALKAKYGVRGIPCLVLIDENDQVVASSYDGEKYLGPNVALRKYLSLK